MNRKDKRRVDKRKVNQVELEKAQSAIVAAFYAAEENDPNLTGSLSVEINIKSGVIQQHVISSRSFGPRAEISYLDE